MFIFKFQAILAVKGRVMLHRALGRKTVIVLLCSGWLYTAFIGLLGLLMPRPQQGSSCLAPHLSFHKIATTLAAASVIMLVFLVVILQTATYWKLLKLQRMAVGPGTNTGRNRMYRRAMVTSSLVATAFLIGWLPLSTSVLLFHWSNIDEETMNTIIRAISILGFLQSFSNPIIFKVRNSSMELKLCKRCGN